MNELTRKEVNERIAQHISNKRPVQIHYNDELGKFVWAVCDAAQPEFWLTSFETKELANNYCNAYNLPVTAVIEDCKDAADDSQARDLIPPDLSAKMGTNKLTDDQVIAQIQKIMNIPGMSELCGLVILNWRTYSLIRHKINETCGDRLSPEVFDGLLQGLIATAMDKFSVVKLRSDMKKMMMPWLKNMSIDCRRLEDKEKKKKEEDK